MDFTQILTTSFTNHWELWSFVIAVTILAPIVSSPWFKGKVGEWFVKQSAKRLPSEYQIINDVTLPTDTGTTQIDHIVVSPYGVFVIETKNYAGAIYGSEKQAQWTQALNKHSKHRFQNPLRQNYKHTQTLKSALNLSDDYIFSVIVFAGNCVFKTEMPENVTKQGDWVRYIQTKKDRVLSIDEVEAAIDIINNLRLERGLKTDIEHVKSLNNQTSCPKCGSDLIERIAKKGKNAGNTFLGCSAFPKCRYMRS
jgi:restriction system protein